MFAVFSATSASLMRASTASGSRSSRAAASKWMSVTAMNSAAGIPLSETSPTAKQTSPGRRCSTLKRSPPTVRAGSSRPKTSAFQPVGREVRGPRQQAHLDLARDAQLALQPLFGGGALLDHLDVLRERRLHLREGGRQPAHLVARRRERERRVEAPGRDLARGAREVHERPRDAPRHERDRQRQQGGAGETGVAEAPLKSRDVRQGLGLGKDHGELEAARFQGAVDHEALCSAAKVLGALHSAAARRDGRRQALQARILPLRRERGEARLHGEAHVGVRHDLARARDQEGIARAAHVDSGQQALQPFERDVGGRDPGHAALGVLHRHGEGGHQDPAAAFVEVRLRPERLPALARNAVPVAARVVVASDRKVLHAQRRALAVAVGREGVDARGERVRLEGGRGAEDRRVRRHDRAQVPFQRRPRGTLLAHRLGQPARRFLHAQQLAVDPGRDAGDDGVALALDLRQQHGARPAMDVQQDQGEDGEAGEQQAERELGGEAAARGDELEHDASGVSSRTRSAVKQRQRRANVCVQPSAENQRRTRRARSVFQRLAVALPPSISKWTLPSWGSASGHRPF